METDGFVFMRSYYAAASKMDPAEQAAFYRAIVEYAFTGAVPEDVGPCVDIAFTLARPTIDKSIERYNQSRENGKKGGRPRKKKPDEKPN